MSSTSANIDNDDNDDYPANAIRCAAVMEGDGSVLHDYYSFEEYIHRRGTFIGKLPANAHLQNACFIARHHAHEIYLNEKNELDETLLLDVEEVRAREIANEFQVLLPLPTTMNTQTIDNFKTCPPKDGSGNVGDDEDDDDGEGSLIEKSLVDSALHSTPATSPLPNEAVQTLGKPAAAQAQVTRPHSEALDLNLDIDDLATPSKYRSILPKVKISLPTDPHTQRTPTVAVAESRQTLDSARTDIKNTLAPPTFTTRSRTKVPTVVVSPPGEPSTYIEAAIDKGFVIDSNGLVVGQTHPTAAATSPNITSNKIFKVHPGVSAMTSYAIAADVKKRHHSPEAESGVTPIPRSAVANMTQPKPNAYVPSPPKATSPVAEIVEPAPKRLRGSRGVAFAAQETVQISAPASAEVVEPAPRRTRSSRGATPASAPVEAVEPAPKRAGSSRDETPAAAPTEAVEPAPKRTRSSRGVANAAKQADDISDLAPTEAVKPTEAVEPAPKRARPSRGAAPPAKKADNTPSPAPTATKPPPRKAALSARFERERHLEAVVAGSALPGSPGEATQAALEVKARLLSEHYTSFPGKEKKRPKIYRVGVMPAEPDMMPHHFSPKNFTAKELEEGAIRCICSVKKNDTEAMFSCDRCEAWQHFGCVYPELTEEQVENVGNGKDTRKMECHVCDPWGRKKVLMTLRAEHPVGEAGPDTPMNHINVESGIKEQRRANAEDVSEDESTSKVKTKAKGKAKPKVKSKA